MSESPNFSRPPKNGKKLVDIFGYTREQYTIVGEIKWTRAPVGKPVFQQLTAKLSAIRPFIKGRLQMIVVSRSGF